MGLFGKKKIEGKTAEEWFELAHSEKNLEKQIDYYTKCLELDPNNLDAWNKGFAIAVLKKRQQGVMIRRWGSIQRLLVYGINSKAFALRALGRYEEAIKCFDSAPGRKQKSDSTCDSMKDYCNCRYSKKQKKR